MFVAMEDMMIRYHRMKGVPALWVPGTDHAGIATQLQVEKDLLRTEEVTREELGREKFLERAWAWKVKYHDIITSQIRRIGASCDWERERFTLDEGLIESSARGICATVRKGAHLSRPAPDQLVTGSEDGSQRPGSGIFRRTRQTILFQIHAGRVERTEYIPVATTRPETILADTAVAVHPEDERYVKFIGKKVIVPILGREIPVIAMSMSRVILAPARSKSLPVMTRTIMRSDSVMDCRCYLCWIGKQK